MNAEMVIEKLKSLGYTLRTDGKNIQLSAEVDPDPEMASALLAELKRCKADAVRLLQNEAWPAEERTMLDWFRSAPIPQAPFQLNAHTRVINSDMFYAALRREIESGPRGARARHGALQCDLMDLHNLLH